MSRIRFEGVSKTFGETTALDGFDLDVGEGEFLALLGPSGCGKTTALRLLAGFLQPTAGRILVDDRDVSALPAHKRNAGMVFQDYALFPHMTVEDNIAFGLHERGQKGAATAKRVAELLDLVRLAGMGRRYPGELSGGQQQRVALARALAFGPSVLLMDEPFGALDLKLREAMQAELVQIQRQLGITTLFVTHDQVEAMAVADLAEDTAILDANGARLTAARALWMETGMEVDAAVRPEWLSLGEAGQATAAAADNVIEGTIAASRFAGSTLNIEVETTGIGRLAVETRSGHPVLRQGTAVSVAWPKEKTIVLRKPHNDG